jgi:hypothetical protein
MTTREKRPFKLEYGGPPYSLKAPGARAESLAKTYPDGWVYILVEYRGSKE